MFDCPEQNHTSPMRMLSSVMESDASRKSVSVILTRCGIMDPAGVLTTAFHFPSLSQTAENVLSHQSGLMAMRDPAPANPHMLTSEF